ncbi:MAG TPA: FAD/NAD(P)-binding protein [Dokdonella sp.]
MRFDVAIVGGGASGVLSAIHLLRAGGAPLRIALIEKRGEPGAGIAYSTRRPEHLLNVTAGRMSAIDADPDHFVRHLIAQAPQSLPAAALASTFAERREYAAYLRATLAQERERSASTLEVIRDEIVAIEREGDLQLASRSGSTLRARCAILALGNWPRALPASSAGVAAAAVLQGWDFAAIAGLDPAHDVLIAGAGLSMVDVVLTLAANRHRGAIHVVSRHALFPLPHARHGGVALDIDALSRLPLSRRILALRRCAREAVARGEPWQWVMDTLRSENAHLWQALSSHEQARFLRHASRYWDIHRHRIPPAAAAVVDAMLHSGQLIRHAGRVASMVPGDGRLRVDIDPTRADDARSIVVDRSINCTGMQSNLERVPDDLVNALLRRGIARRGPHGIGLATDAAGALVDAGGHADPRLSTLGSVRIGQLWESVAIPELRVQAAILADRLGGCLTGGF